MVVMLQRGILVLLKEILALNHGKLHLSAANTRRFQTVNMVE